MYIDDVPVGNYASQHVVHLQLQDSVKRAHDGPHLAHDTHSHAVLIALDDIKGVSKVPFCDVEDDVGLVGGVQRCDSPQKDDLLRTGELSKGGQRDDGVGDGMYRVPHAGLIVGTARLDAADGVCFLLAEAAEKHRPGRLVAKPGQQHPGNTRSSTWSRGTSIST